MAISFPFTVSFWTIPAACFFARPPRYGFRLTRYGANAPGHTTSSIATSIDDECDEKFLASCEYAASDADGCGTSFTLMPVSLWNRATSSRSRLWLDPTAFSPMNVIFWPLYFLLSAAAPATFGGLTAAAAVLLPAALLAPPAVAALSETSRANSPATPTRASTPRCFTISPPSSHPVAARAASAGAQPPSRRQCLPLRGLSCQRAETSGGGRSWPPPERRLGVGRLRGGRRRRAEVGRVRVRVVAVRQSGGTRSGRVRRRGRGGRASLDEGVRRRSVADRVDERPVGGPQPEPASRGRD